jgi:hypothetical protein
MATHEDYGTEVQRQMGMSNQFHASTALPPSKFSPDTFWIGDGMGCRGGMDSEEERKSLALP